MTDIAKCKSCGSDKYLIQHIYTTYGQRLLIVECGECRYEIIPVVVYIGMSQDEVYGKCEAAWNEANTSISNATEV